MDSDSSIIQEFSIENVGIDIINNICKFTDEYDFSSMRSALCSSFSQNIEYTPEVIVSTKDYKIDDIMKQLSAGKLQICDEIDEYIKNGDTNITLDLVMYPNGYNNSLSETFIYDSKLTDLLRLPIFSEYIVKINKIIISIVSHDKFLNCLAMQVRESYICNEYNKPDLISTNFDVIYNYITKQKKKIIIENLTLEHIRIVSLFVDKNYKSLKRLTIINGKLNDCSFNNLDYLFMYRPLICHDTYSMKNIKELYLNITLSIDVPKCTCDIENVQKLKIVNDSKFDNISFINTHNLKDLIVDMLFVSFDDLSSVKKLSTSLHLDNKHPDFGYKILLQQCINVEELTFIESRSKIENNSKNIIIFAPKLKHLRSYINIYPHLVHRTSNLLTIQRILVDYSNNENIFCSIIDVNTVSNVRFLCNTYISINNRKFIPDRVKIIIQSGIYTDETIRCISYHKTLFYEYMYFNGISVQDKYDKLLNKFPNIRKYEFLKCNYDEILELDLSEIERGFFLKNKTFRCNRIRNFISVKAHFFMLLKQNVGLYIPIHIGNIQNLINEVLI